MVFMNQTDKDWEVYGEKDPYYGVVSRPEFTREFLSKDGKVDFFQTGEKYLEATLDVVKENFGPDFHPERTLDFGCGVGRLAIPLSYLSQSVLGVDVSASMLEEARTNCTERGITNISFVQGDDALSQMSGGFDFIHSFIVFQHIPRHRGEQIFVRLLELLSEGGIGVLHFTYAKDLSLSRLFKYRFYKMFPFFWSLRNLVKGRPQRPMMQMNLYDLNKLFSLLQDYGCHNCVVRFSSHGTKGVILYFQKQQLPVF